VTADQLLPLMTFALGQVFILVSQSLNDRRLLRREREARAEESRVKWEQERAAFQRQNLLDLQQALFDYGRALARLFHEDSANARKAGVWGKLPISDEWNEKELLAGREVRLFKSRTDDGGLRMEVNSVLEESLKLKDANSEMEAVNALNRTFDVFDRAVERAGELLRDMRYER
jgi:hypothetical protein